MYKYLVLLWMTYSLCLFTAQAEEVGAPSYTYTYDTARVARYQQDKRFDYNSQLSTPEFSLWDYLMRALSKLLRKVLGNKYAGMLAKPILIGICAVILGLVIFFIYKKRPELFYRVKKKPWKYQVYEGENIYEINFEKEIEALLSQQNYPLAIRLIYLQTLRYLADQGRINWQPSKTPTDYLYEIKGTAGKEAFRHLTGYFLKIRYGNFEAGEALYNKVKEWQGCLLEKEGATDEK